MAKLLYRSSLTPPMPQAVATGSAVKGAPLTLNEGDYNFKALNDEIATKASLDSPTFAGTPTAPTAAPGMNNTQIATTEFVTAAIESSPGGIEYERVIAPVTLVDKQGVLADTTAGSFTITLPSSPVVGTQSFVADGGDWSINNLIIDPNGQQIDSLSVDENLILDIGGASIQFVFDGVIWRVFSTLTTGAITGDLLASVLSSAPSKTAPNDNDKTNLIDSEDAWSLKSLTFANLKAWIGSLFVSKSGDTISGNLNFSGAGRRITGDFSNATVADRLMFQTSTSNANTVVQALPNGSGPGGFFGALNSSDTSNFSRLMMGVSQTSASIESQAQGTGGVLPLTFWTNNAERLRIDNSGNVVLANGILNCGNGQTAAHPPVAIAVNPTAHATSKRASISLGSWIVGQDSNGTGVQDFFLYDSLVGASRLSIGTTGNVLVTGGALGYGVGAGGTVVQATSKSTPVVLNKPSGRIEMHPSPLGAGASVIFTLVNNKINHGSTLVVTLYDGGAAANYRVECVGVDVGAATIRLTNVSGASRTETMFVYFNVIVGIAG